MSRLGHRTDYSFFIAYLCTQIQTLSKNYKEFRFSIGCTETYVFEQLLRKNINMYLLNNTLPDF